MRPTSTPQSAIRTPLNAILGTEARVRILRVLSSADAPVAAGDVARQTALQPSGVRVVLAELVDAGIVEMLGTGKSRLARLAVKHPMATPLMNLFAEERHRAERIIDRIRAAALSVFPTPVAHVWIEGPLATNTDRPGDPIIVGLLARATDVDAATSALRDAMAPIEQEEDVTIEIQSRTHADLKTLTPAVLATLGYAIPLVGVWPLSLVEPTAASQRARSHADLDARALAFARAIAKKLARDPSLVASARRAIASRLTRASPTERQTLSEWDQILATSSLPRLRRLLVDAGPRATRLRQSLPFLDALSQRERDAILRNPEQAP
jgi:DNA-binding transcriptional ArsR family regulator